VAAKLARTIASTWAPCVARRIALRFSALRAAACNSHEHAVLAAGQACVGERLIVIAQARGVWGCCTRLYHALDGVPFDSGLSCSELLYSTLYTVKMKPRKLNWLGKADAFQEDLHIELSWIECVHARVYCTSERVCVLDLLHVRMYCTWYSSIMRVYT
jgi:hypothetical protein